MKNSMMTICLIVVILASQVFLGGCVDNTKCVVPSKRVNDFESFSRNVNDLAELNSPISYNLNFNLNGTDYQCRAYSEYGAVRSIEFSMGSELGEIKIICDQDRRDYYILRINVFYGCKENGCKEITQIEITENARTKFDYLLEYVLNIQNEELQKRRSKINQALLKKEN